MIEEWNVETDFELVALQLYETKMAKSLRMNYVWGKIPLILVLASLFGCQSIPDVSHWNDATRDLSGAVITGFKSAASINSELGKKLEEQEQSKAQSERYGQVAGVLADRANDYEKLFGAIADYSGSLAAIAKAADGSQKTVDGVAGSVNKLIGVLGGTALAGAGFELGKLLAGEIIKVKAAQDFGDAVQKADPLIGQLADLIVKDLNDLSRTVSERKDAAIRQAIRTPLQEKLDYRTALTRRQAELQATLKGALTGKTFSSSTDAPELARVEQFLRDTDAWYRPYAEDLSRALATRSKSEELIIQSARAVQAWRSSHASLADAVRERRLPESARLAALAIQIRELAEEIKKGK